MEAILDVTFADGSRVQLYAYEDGPEHPGATALRIWGPGERRPAEVMIPQDRENLFRDFFDSTTGRHDDDDVSAI